MKTTSIKSASLILMALFMSISISVRADVTPSVSLKTYYSTADGKASGQLRTALYEIINPHTTVSYDDLAYLMKYSDTQDADGTNVVDIYSNCTFTVTSDKLTWTGSGSAVGNGMNREHTVPQSWFSNASPMVSDAFHIYPTDARSNNNRSSYLYGEFTGSGTSYSSSSCSESGKLSSSSGTQTIAAYTYKGEDYYPPSTYTGKVYEPADEYKGDIARSYFYMATCYASECATWGGGAFGTDNEGFTQYTAELMLKWHRLDPVSEKELIRNEVIYGNTTYNKGTKKQGNRNPFIDYPELAEYIWGEKAGEPVSFDDLTSAYSVPCSGNLTTPNVTAVAGDQQITLTWSDVEGATSYTVSIGKGVGYTTECSSPSIGAITHSGTTNTCVITGLVNGLSYTTSVVATSSTTCDSDADLDTTTPTDTPITTHTITWSVNGTETPVVYNDGEALILPSTPSDCSGEGGKVFVGWTASSSVSGYAPADLFTEASGTVTADITYYAVYATASTSGTSASLTKLEQGDEANLALEDNIVIVAKGTNLALYQESTSTKYAKNWTFDNNVATVAADDKNYLTLYSTDDDYTTWHLGDDTNGYLYNSGSNNELVVNKTSPVYWEFKWNTTQSAYTIKRSGYTRYLSCRTDLAGSSVNLYRMVSGTGTGTAFFDIYLYVAGSGSGTTTYSNYSLTCDVPATCTNEITITKGEDPANGTFSIDNSGTVCIDEGNATVIVTAEPSEHYHLATVTTTGSVGTVGSISGNTCTITGINASTTINVTFAADPTHTATFMNCGVAYGVAQTGYAGTSISAPAGTPEACEGYMFVGWVTSEQTAEATSHSEAVTFPQTMPSSDITYYALYRRMEGGGGSATETYGFETTDDATNWEFSGVEAYDTYAKTGSKSGKIARTSVGYSSVTYKNKVNVTSFSYQFLRQTTNDNYTVFIETSSDKSTWDVAASYAMSSYSAKETWYQNSHTFDGETALYVRFNCYTSTAIRWVDDISITYNGGGTAYYTTSPSCTGHTVTVSSVEHGSATATPTYCDEGVTVTVTLIADEGYECSGITTDPVVSTSGTGCTYTFSMPASDITVTPAFVPKTPRTFTFVPGTGICATESMSEGVWNAGVTLPTATANSGCDPEYVFAGWATSSVSETEVRPTLYKAGENYNGEDLTLYAVYAQTTGGSSVGFTLSYTKDDITYYATARSGSNSYMGASTDIAEAAHFSVVTSNDKHFLCWHGTEDTYIYTGTSNNTNLSFTTDIASAKNGWTVTETDATLKLQSNGNDRYFMFNTNQKDRFAAYAAEGELTKGDAGTTTYNSAPSCTCTSVDITYNANDGELADGCENVTGGDCGRNWKLCDAPTRDGYLFSGWKDLSGNLYDAGATITDLKISLTLTAQWIPAPYTVLFDAGTGSCIESLTEASRGDGITLPKAEPSAACADDWTFIGWSETKITDEALTATIIGVSGVNYIPTANNTTLYAVYRRVDTEGATSDYSRVSDDTPVEGDYVIVVARNDESFGKMTYGTLNNGRLTYTKDYTALPATISSPAATEIWHLTYDGDGYAYLYNANAGAYLAVEDSKITYDAYGGAKFLFTRDPGTYGDFQCLNYTASDYDYYYLGANVSSDYIRYYKGQTLIDLYSVTLYQGSAGTRYYSTEPQCTPCTDPEWSFALGTSVVKSKGSAPFINTVNKVYDSAGTVTYSSTNEAVATVDNTGLVTLVGTGTTTITLRLAKAMPTCAKRSVIVVVPVPTNVTRPVLSTVATASFVLE